jgi:2-methylcitrate dehydratase PrpD
MPEDAPITSAAATIAADVARFVHSLAFESLPAAVVQQAERCLLDLAGIAAGGSTTELSRLARAYASTHLCSTDHPARILFDGRRAGTAGAAFAGAATIDALDGHDGHRLTKGHAGVAILPTLLALADERASRSAAVDPREFIVCFVVGYEIATRAGIALHASVSDYHCSGAWNAIGSAAVAARFLGLDDTQTREALGIAEYFGPRGQMMRTCAAPSMVKDGSGWGAHTGVTAAWLAREGFTGAPAVTVEHDAPALWSDLGTRWRILEQYFKPYPVCRWAQPAIEAALRLQRAHVFVAEDIEQVTIVSFAEAVALAPDRAIPRTTEDAQYSLAYPVAAALAFGRVGPAEVTSPTIDDARVHRLLSLVALRDDPELSSRFPAERLARVDIRLRDGRVLQSTLTEARGDPEAPLSDDELREKFEALAVPVLGATRAKQIEQRVTALRDSDSLDALLDALLQPAA